jgi:hypothetical protein
MRIVTKYQLKCKLLFICKAKNNYGNTTAATLSTGLYNSALQVVDLLNAQGYDTTLVSVIDNNDIDREVSAVRPDVVVIEAIWVVPSKFDVLTQLHPTVTWIVRIHSEMSFIACEGIALDWLTECANKPNVMVGVNSDRMIKDLATFVDKDKLVYMPNYYDLQHMNTVRDDLGTGDRIQIACFGALRILKDQLSQAVAAIKFANDQGSMLDYHINTARQEGYNSDNILKNIRAVFKDSPHTLIEHGWLPHDEFLALVRTMDMGLQVSFSETFNIVAADFISQMIPLVVSKEIKWLSNVFKTKTNSVDDIYEKMVEIWYSTRMLPQTAVRDLQKYNSNALDAWKLSLKGLSKLKPYDFLEDWEKILWWRR